MTIEVEAKAGNFHDAAQWKIPVRTEGLVNKSFSLEQQRGGERLFTFDDEVVRGKLLARLAPFPSSVLAEPLQYLLFYSPKSPSEWLVKTAQTALEAESLTKAGLLTGDLVQSGAIRLAEGKKMAISELLTAVLFQLKGRQDWDGGIKEQDRSDYPSRFWEQKNTSSLLTSISTYALLETMKTNGYANLVPKDFSERLERYLAKLGSDSPELYLYYLAQRKTNLASINTALVSQLQKKYPNNIAIQALSFYLLAQNAGEADAIRLAQSVEKLFEQAFAQGRYFEGVPLTSLEELAPELAALAEVAGDRNAHLSLDLKALQGFYLRGVLKLHTRFPKQEHFTNQISSQILSLLKSRSAYGLWSWSSTTNFAVLTALNAALTSYYQHQSQTTHCVLQVGNTKLELDAGKTCVEKSIPFEHTKDLKVQRSCEGPAFLDLQVNSLLKDITKKKTELHNVEKLTFEYPATAQIGEKIPLKAGFKTLKEAQNLTVEFTIPSRFKFWSNLQVAENSFEKGVFDFGNDRACFPDFYEFRFDRVILNYGTMKAGKECNFTFYAVNAFDGQFVYPPSKLYEQQATQVW